MEITPIIGVGGGDLLHAGRVEVRRIIKESGGDEFAQCRILIGRLRERDLISDSDAENLTKISEVGRDASKVNARRGYFETRDILNNMLIGGDASPVALAIASCAVGSYSIGEDRDGGSGTVAVAKTAGTWEQRGALAGALIGGIIGGAGGAAIGGLIGGEVGEAVDECLED